MQGEDGGGGLVNGFGVVLRAAGGRVGDGGQAQAGGKRGGGEQGDEGKESGNANPVGDERAEDEREDEGDADARAEHCHRLAEFFRRGDVGGIRQRDGGNRPHALHRTRGNHHIYVAGTRGEQAARDKEGETARDDRFAPVAVGEPAVGDLQQPLTESIDAKRDADQGFVRPRQLVRIQAEHGENHEQAEHPRDVNGGEGGNAALPARLAHAAS